MQSTKHRLCSALALRFHNTSLLPTTSDSKGEAPGKAKSLCHIHPEQCFSGGGSHFKNSCLKLSCFGVNSYSSAPLLNSSPKSGKDSHKSHHRCCLRDSPMAHLHPSGSTHKTEQHRRSSGRQSTDLAITKPARAKPGLVCLAVQRRTATLAAASIRMHLVLLSLLNFKRQIPNKILLVSVNSDHCASPSRPRKPVSTEPTQKSQSRYFNCKH